MTSCAMRRMVQAAWSEIGSLSFIEPPISRAGFRELLRSAGDTRYLSDLDIHCRRRGGTDLVPPTSALRGRCLPRWSVARSLAPPNPPTRRGLPAAGRTGTPLRVARISAEMHARHRWRVGANTRGLRDPPAPHTLPVHRCSRARKGSTVTASLRGKRTENQREGRPRVMAPFSLTVLGPPAATHASAEQWNPTGLIAGERSPRQYFMLTVSCYSYTYPSPSFAPKHFSWPCN